MKKSLFFVLLSLGGFNTLFSQTTIFSENFGNPGCPGPNFPSGWTVTGDLQTDASFATCGSIPDCNVLGSSGNGKLLVSDGTSGLEEAITPAFSTTGLAGITVSWNGIRANTSAPTMSLMYSINSGATWVNVPFTDVAGDDTWHALSAVTLPGACDNVSSLLLKLTYTSGNLGIYCAFDDFLVQGGSSPIFYWNGVGALTTLSSWGTNTNGTGTQPISFNLSGQEFNIVNASAASLVANWSIGGSNTKVNIGDGSSQNVNFTLPAAFNITFSGGARMFVLNNSTITLVNTAPPAVSNFSILSGSTVDYAQSSVVTLWATTYHNLTISGGADKNQSGNPVVNGTLNLSNGGYVMSNGIGQTTTLNGSIIGTGLIKTATNARLNLGGTASSTLNFGTGVSASSFSRLLINRPGATITCGTSFTVNSTTSLTNGNINLNGNRVTFNGDLTLPASSGNGVFIGSTTSSITIGGSGALNNNLLFDQTSASTRAINEITLNRASSTLTFGNAIEAWGSITPSNGTIATGGVLTLKANGSTKGRIGVVGTSGTLSGNVTVEVFKPAGVTGWVNLCSGGVNGNNMNSWNSSFAITCSVCPDGWQVDGQNFTSIYEYDETAATGNSADPAHYIELGIAPASKAIDSKTGYWVYLGNDFPNTTAITIPLTGAVNTKNSSGNINLTLTGGAGPENGWNLIANPFPSPIVANQITGSGFNTTNMIAYDPDTDSNIPFSGSAVIPTGQAFMVQATAGGANLTPAESWKSATADNTSILRSSSSNYYFNDFLIDVTSNVVPSNFFTQAYFAFGNGYTNNYETADCPSMPGQFATTPRFYSKYNNMDLLRNALPAPTGTITIPLLMHTGYAGAYTFSPINISKLPAGACVTLVDLVNNVSHNLRTGAYTTNIIANATTPQFELRIVVNNTNLTSSFVHPTCTKLANASINAQGTGTGPWNYIWKDGNGNVIQTNNNVNGSNTLNNIYAGSYIVDITKNNTCENARATFTLNATTPLPIANFSANTPTVTVGNNVPVSFTNLSSNATGYEWNFNDGSNIVTTANASHVFNDEGNYSVILKANNGACLDTAIYTIDIFATAMPVGIKDKVAENNNYFISKDEQGLFVKFNYENFSEVQFEVSNILGQVLIPNQILSVSQSKHYFNVSENEKIIFVTITENGIRKTSKVIAK